MATGRNVGTKAGMAKPRTAPKVGAKGVSKSIGKVKNPVVKKSKAVPMRKAGRGFGNAGNG